MTGQRGWDRDRHGHYPTTDLPLSAVPEAEWLIRTSIFRHVLRPLARQYLPPPALPEHLELIDCFFVRYSCLAEGEQTELTCHTDGSTFSFNVLLNDPCEFEGGGTRFFHASPPRETGRSAQGTNRPRGTTVHVRRGAALAHSGHVEHSGVKITKGERYILVGFVGSVVYPYTAGLAAHAEQDAFGKFGAAAWDRSPERSVCRPVAMSGDDD